MEKEFTQLIMAHQGIIHKVCSIYCKDREDRSDLFQEIVLQLWRAWPDFRQQALFKTWMYRIALNTAISSFRRQQKQRLPGHWLSAALYHPQPDEQLEQLYQAIEDLSQVEKAIVMLYLEEHSYQEIAAILGISESNVGVKLNRIKTKLKKMITHGVR